MKANAKTGVNTFAVGPRWDGLDALRACAMLWMTAFHFSFDLSHAGLWPQNFYSDPVWTWQRTCILSLFLLCAGAGLKPSHSNT
ncbi:MAG: heparan-alpha-glucosaminide N-acetyltransferase domain-containing protein [Rhodoferax sp.]|nr:heparan-alpha-glucosaminide N-acetyltransferase domain-containing protein [Rhodoferax sp.]